MARIKGGRRRVALLLGAVTVLGAGVAVSMGTTFAASPGENCDALATALRNNQNFIAQQQELARQNPGAAAVFQGRIDNRNAVIANIQSRQQAAGCNDQGGANQGGANQGGAANSGNANAGGQNQNAVCQGLSNAVRNNQNFIAQQEELARQNPGAAAVFQGRIANRQAVIENIQSRLQALGC